MEKPISNKLLLDFNAGVGGVVEIPEGRSINLSNGSYGITKMYLSPFFKSTIVLSF